MTQNTRGGWSSAVWQWRWRGRHWRARGATVPDPVATFSILGFDPATGEVGGAVQSRVFSVGNGVLWAEAGVGAAATQAIVDVSYGPKAIALLRAGMAPDGDHQGDLGQRPRSAARALDQAGPAIRGHRRSRGHRGVHRAEGERAGPATAPASTARRRATSSPARRWSASMVARVRVHDRGICRGG